MPCLKGQSQHKLPQNITCNHQSICNCITNKSYYCRPENFHSSQGLTGPQGDTGPTGLSVIGETGSTGPQGPVGIELDPFHFVELNALNITSSSNPINFNIEFDDGNLSNGTETVIGITGRYIINTQISNIQFIVNSGSVDFSFEYENFLQGTFVNFPIDELLISETRDSTKTFWKNDSRIVRLNAGDTIGSSIRITVTGDGSIFIGLIRLQIMRLL